MAEITTNNIIIKYETNLSNIDAELKRATKSAENFEKAAADGSESLGKGTQGIQRGLSGINGTLNTLKNGLKAFIGFKAIQLAVNSVRSLGGGLLSTAVEAEKTNTSFEILAGGVQNATKLLKELDEFSLKTPFEPKEVQAAAKTLLSFGRTNQDVLKDVDTLGNIAAATGADLGNLAVILGQVAGAGKLGGQDALQFVNAGVPIYALLSESLGVSIGQVKDLQSQGKITFDVLNEALQKATGESGKFAGALIKQSQTLGGLISTASGAVTEIGKRFSSALLPVGKVILPPLIDGLFKIANFAQSAADPIGRFLVGAFIKLKEVSTPVLSAFSNLRSAFTELLKPLIQIKGETSFLSGALTVLSNVVSTAVNAFAAFLKIGFVRDSIRGIIVAVSAIPAVFNGVIEAGKALANNLQIDFQEVALDAKILYNEIKGVFSESAKLRADALIEQKKDLVAQRKGVIDAFKDGFAAVSNATLPIPDAEQKQVIKDEWQDVGGDAGKAFGEELSKEQKKAIDQAAKDQKKAAENIIDLRNAAIESAAGREIEGIKTDTRRAIEALVGTPEQIQEQTDLLIAARDKAIQAVKEGVASDQLKVKFEAEVELQRRESDEEKAVIEAEKLATDAKLREIEKSRLAVKNQLKAGLIDAEEAALQEQQLNLESLEVQRQQTYISELDRLAIKNQIADAEIENEKRITEAQKQEIAERRKAVVDAAKEVISIAKQIADARIAELDRQIKEQQKRVDESLKTAEKGNAEQVQLEEDRLNKLNQAREEAAQRQRVISAIEIATNSAVAVSQGIVGVTAAFKEGNLVKGIATSIALAATVASSVIAIKGALSGVGSFAKGTEFLTAKDGKKTKGTGMLIEAHAGERILTADQNKQIGKMPNKKLVEYVKAGKQALASRANIAASTGRQTASVGAMAVSDVRQMQLEIGGLKAEMQQTNAQLQITNRTIKNIKNQVIIDKDGIRTINQKFDNDRAERARAAR